ncbi:hypothetical protein [Flavobacterium sp. 3HN19-14]|uniref:hypothetical protein n=1 Tax=Flavobacterium sp. 3HN19-14 TaxID=3448133 RepID=UPI003EDE8745
MSFFRSNNKKKLASSINIALNDLDAYPSNNLSIQKFKKVLEILKSEAQNENSNINARVLRSMHDVGASSVKEFENTLLEKSIHEVVKILYYEIPSYKKPRAFKNGF